MSMVMKGTSFVPRYNAVERSTHWTLAISFVIATISGLALFHPAFWFLSGFLGGGVWSKTLHPWAGLVMFIAFVPMALWYWRDNLIRSYDIAWMKRLPEVLMNTGKDLPEIDKYNAGQKMLFWSIIASLVVLLLSGFVLWFDTDYKLPALLIRLSGAAHVLAAFVLFMGMIVHIYSAVFWIRGSMRAMVRGEVKVGWAKHHHPLWYKRVTGKGK
ncbi:MAG: formate dehydrogenase subunit gamma [Burkholderiaceae bacterium]|nr:formate dehydrogenase subunit gamma [Burkholderiaceae bacterium]